MLTPGNETLDKAIVLDQAENTAVTGFVINGGCNYGVYVKNSSSFYLADLDISNVSLKGLCVMGENTGFALVNNSIHENQNGAIFLNGEISNGVIEGNRIENNSGARNLTAGLVLCSMPIEDIETAYNPFPDEMLYDILQSPHQLVVRGQHGCAEPFLRHLFGKRLPELLCREHDLQERKRGHVPGLRLLRQLHYRM